jgi:stringent starvation protein B
MSTPSRPLPPKKDVAMALLQGPSVYIHLDPRKPEVMVPAWFKKQAQLVLQVGLNMAIPIPDLKVDEDGVSCTLSFNRAPFWCRLPWTAIYALVGEDGRGMVWPSEVPSEVAAQMEGKAARPASVKPVPAPGASGSRPRPAKEPKKKRATAASRPERPAGPARPQGNSAQEIASPGAPSASSPEVPGRQEMLPPKPSAPPSAPQKEPSSRPGKRELPPYLRVVK